MTPSKDHAAPPVSDPPRARPITFDISEPRVINERRAQLENAEMLRRLRSL